MSAPKRKNIHMKAAIYLRVSTDDQNEDIQLQPLLDLAKRKELQLYEIYKDHGHSGAKLKRPGLDRLMADAKKGRFKAVLVWRFDRFARSTKHLVLALDEFEHRGIAFLSLQETLDTSTPLGKAMFSIIASMAQLERDIISERTKAALAYVRVHGTQSGKPIGRPKLRNDEEIRKLRDDGNSFRLIARLTGVSKAAVQRSLLKSGLINSTGSVRT